MLNIQAIRENKEHIMQKLALKGEKTEVVEEIYLLDVEYRKHVQDVEELKYKRNQISKKIGDLKRNGEDTNEIFLEVGTIGEQIKIKDDLVEELKEKIFNKLSRLPNIIDDSVPFGNDESENVELHKWGEPKTFDFTPIPHWDLVTTLQIVDFERAAKITGSRFAIYKGAGSKLVRALANFMIDTHLDNGYEEISTPVIANQKSLFATGQLPKFAEDVFKLKLDREFYLIPTAEVTLTNYYRDEIIDATKLPINLTGYSQCFRSEAGSAGRDTRGLIRQHQFEKVELVHFTKQEESFEMLEKLREEAELILKLLKLPYRTITLCSGDTGFSSAKTYDIEVWLPSYSEYKEISSCSNCTDFQARRGNIRYRDENGKTKYVHTLNGSGLAIGRTVAAIIENYQTEEGAIIIPEVLVPYMNGMTEIK